jgi:phage-related minor tail protein
VAFAETANLIVALKLKDEISAPLRAIDSRLSKVGVNTALVGQGLGKVGRGLGVGLRNSAIIAGVGVAALSTQIVAGVNALRELEVQEKQTEAVIKSTGGAAGVTAVEVRRLAEEYETWAVMLSSPPSRHRWTLPPRWIRI